jgi:hypothetical protein
MEATMTRWVQLIMAGVAAVAIACGGDVSSPLEGGPSATKGTNKGTDSTGGNGGNGGNGGQTSNGPVTSVTLSPRTLSLPVGYYSGLVATARDAQGARVVKPVAWRSSNAAVVSIASDTGVVRGISIGTAKIYATVDGHTDSATVTVVPTPPPPPPPPPPAAAVAEFNMVVVAMGPIQGADTSRVERVAGATITLTRRGTAAGDSLATPVEAGSAVADSRGEAKFTKLTGGTYSIRITPPAGSPYAETMSGIAPPRQSDITVNVTMQRR